MNANTVCHSYRVIGTILITCLLWTSVAGSVRAAPVLPQEYTFQECDRVGEAELRDELNIIAQQAIVSEALDLNRIVERQWIALGMDDLIDTEVDQAIERVRREEDYLGRLWSGWSAEKAKELATRVANYAFGAEAFKAAMVELSNAIAADITTELETVSARSASSALICIQEFIGARYSENMVAIFESELAQQVEGVDFADIDPNVSLLETHSTALAGFGVIIGTQIAKRLANKIAQRLAGKIVGRVVGRAAASFVPIAGWIIGTGLIVWDLIEGGKGALPQIEEALKSSDVKQEIRAEVVDTIDTELDSELPQVARAIANDIYSSWVDFKQEYENVLELAAQNPDFKELLDNASTAEIFKLSKFVAVGLETLGPDALEAAIVDGTFERAFYLPESALEILTATESLDRTIAWAEVAGRLLDDVVALEIYKLKMPEDFDRDALPAIVDLQDRAVVAKVLLLNRDAVNTLLRLPPETVQELAHNFTVDDLTWLAGYLDELEDLSARNQLVTRLIDSPEVINELKNENVKAAIVESNNVEETIDFLASPRSVESFVMDTMTLWQGNVSWWQHYRKYAGVWITILVILALLILRFAWWYIRPFRSPRI